MTEDVLQYIWKTQSFTRADLRTSQGESVQVINQGVHNLDAGPDFSTAHLLINDVKWVGDVEIHTRSSEWNNHKHHLDQAYNKVVLHVVWQHDVEVFRADGTEIPALELNQYISKKWLMKYELLLASVQIIPCEYYFKEVEQIHKFTMFNKVLVNRLQRKSENTLNQLEVLKGDWEGTSLALLFEHFGFKKNNVAFKQLASIINFHVLRKLNSRFEIEAYLFGMSGLLSTANVRVKYLDDLRAEFAWQQKKFAINPSPMDAKWWKFMRLRPANFPTQRLAQLASFLAIRKQFFQDIIELPPIELLTFFRTKQSEFWQSHYHFNKVAEHKIGGIGKQSARLLCINVVAPILVAYAGYIAHDKYIEKAIFLLESLIPEENAVTRHWNRLGVAFTNAAESQGAIELFNNYCAERKCLNCSIGQQILKFG